MREYAASQKTKFATNINHTKHSRSASMRAFGCRVSCIGNKRQIPLAPGDSLIQRKRRIQVLVIQWLQAHITLFSKYFASFPHGTCSLSDSRRYLALDEIYHLISAPIPGNATLRFRTLRGTSKRRTGLSPFAAPLSRGRTPAVPLVTDQDITTQNTRFCF
jgi:hypothetical protein